MDNPTPLQPDNSGVDSGVAVNENTAVISEGFQAADAAVGHNNDTNSYGDAVPAENKQEQKELPQLQAPNPNSGQELAPQPVSQPIPETMPEPVPEPVSAPDPVTEPVREPEPEQASQPASKPSPESLSQPEPETLPESVPQPDPEPLPKSVPQPDPEPLPESVPQPDAEPLPETVSQPDPEPVPEPVSQPEPESLPEPVSQPESERASVRESEPLLAQEVAPAPEPEFMPAPKLESAQEEQQDLNLDVLPNKEAALQEQRLDTKPANSHGDEETNLKVKGEANGELEVKENKNNNNNDDNNTDSTGNDNEYNPKHTEDKEEKKEQKTISEAGLQQDDPKLPSPKPKTAAQIDRNNLAVPQSHEIVIPNYARWFNLTKIHPIERNSLPEFFTNRIPSKTPQVYVKYRNFMVNSYRLNPNEYFSVTTARRNVCGDAAAIFRIHKFLMKWGLINYQVDAKLLPKSVEPPFTGEYSTRHDAPRGLFPFESYKPSVQLPDMAKLKKMMDTEDDGSALHRYLNDERLKSHAAAPGNTPAVKEEEGGQDKRERHEGENVVENPHGAKRPKIVENSTNADDGWDKEGVQKLLTGIQTHGSDWYKIAKEVGNKTPEQCILKFLQMPIEDKFLHQNERGSDLGSLKYAPHLPFSKSENPVMSTLAFLVGLVDPKTVQKMTDRALKSMEDVDKPKEDPPNTKEASELAISSLGVRSHVFATNEERQMNAIAHQMAQVQLQKVEAKLKLLDKIEKSLELEKKVLQRQQEDVLVQRISLAKHSRNVHQKLEDSLKFFDDKEKLADHVAEIKELINNPPKLSIGSAYTATEGNEKSPNGSNDRPQGEVKPVSIEAPQFYRYWSA